MTNLTELKDGAFYYTINGIEEAHFCEVNGVPELVMPELEEVLAEVPDYIEWRNYVNGYCEEHEAYNRLIEENAKLKEDYNRLGKLLQKMEDSDNAREKFQNGQIEKLKELLKECKDVIEWYKADYKDADVLNEDVITKIDEVLK